MSSTRVSPTPWSPPGDPARRRCVQALCHFLPFAAAPLVVNLVVWSVIHRANEWPMLIVEDLAYFAIAVAGETTLVGFAEPRARGLREGAYGLLLVAPMFVVFAATLVLAKWQNDVADPAAAGLFTPQHHAFIAVVGACSVVALAGAVAKFYRVAQQPGRSLESNRPVLGRFIFAAFPVIGTALLSVFDPAPNQIFRPTDLCFFSIAVCGPAGLDLVVHSSRPSASRAVWSLFPWAVTLWASVLLGFWYFVRLVQLDQPATNLAISIGVQRNALACALAALVVGYAVHRWLSGRRRKTGNNQIGGFSSICRTVVGKITRAWSFGYRRSQ